MAVADAVRVPAGKALAVDRELFAGKVTELVEAEPNITLVRKAIADLDDPALEGFERVVISAGPLASESLSASIARAVGAEHLYFYDAIAPIVAADSIDMGIAFWGSRYGEPGEGDYLNCPMNEEEYKAFYQGLLDGEKVASREFEQEKHFEGCMPVEALAARGPGKERAEPGKRQRQGKAQIPAQAAQHLFHAGERRQAPGGDQNKQAQQRQRETHAGGRGQIRPFRPFFDNSRLLFCHVFPPEPPPAPGRAGKWALRRILYYTGRM